MDRVFKRNKRRDLAAIIIATIMLSISLGEPLYAQTTQTPSGTGKTLTAVLLGKPRASMRDMSPYANPGVQQIRATPSE